METSVETLEPNKVRLHVAVPATEFDKAIDVAFRELAREVRIPGFRPGKAPRRLLEARLGSELARTRALRDALPGYYSDAVTSEGLDAIAPPEIELTSGEDDGDVEFDAVVELRPVAELDGYDGIEVSIPAPSVDDEALDRQVDALRDRFAELEDSGAPLVTGDFAQIDIRGYVHTEVVDGLTATDFLYELGSGIVVEELDAELVGKRPGDILKFNAVLPERWGERAGDEVAFQVLVKETKRKVLPEPTDEWVSEVSEFETLAGLRDDVRRRLELVARVQAQMLVRDRVLDAATELVHVDVPDTLVREEVERRLHDLGHRLEASGAGLEQYLAATGRSREELLAEVREGAVKGVQADLALRAVVTQEGIEAGEADVESEIERLAERMQETPAKVRRELERRGGLEAVRSDVARGKALEFLVDHAVVIDEEGNPLDLALPDETGDEAGPGAGGRPDDAAHAETQTTEMQTTEMQPDEQEPDE